MRPRRVICSLFETRIQDVRQFIGLDFGWLALIGMISVRAHNPCFGVPICVTPLNGWAILAVDVNPGAAAAVKMGGHVAPEKFECGRQLAAFSDALRSGITIRRCLERLSARRCMTNDMATDTPAGIARDTCPRCASHEVTHLLIGLVYPLDADSGAPEWVESVGCVHPGYDRVCKVCGHTWQCV